MAQLTVAVAWTSAMALLNKPLERPAARIRSLAARSLAALGRRDCHDDNDANGLPQISANVVNRLFGRVRVCPWITVVVVVLLFAAPHAANAQPAGKVSRIGYLSPLSPAADATRREAFRQGLAERGYREGQNIAIEYRWAEGKLDRQDDLAAELVRLKVEVILAAGGHHTVRAAKKATASIPIVMTAGDDPVASGLVASLARPGGNVTGLNTLGLTLAGKRLELLREMLPGIRRVAVLWNPAVPERATEVKNTQLAARTLDVEIQSLEVRSAEDLDDKFKALVRGRAEALVILSDPVTNTHRAKIIEFATTKRVPTMFALVDAGGLVSYGTNYEAVFRHAAMYVDKILKGTKPAELPIQQPTKFELVINMNTAKALGLTIPPSLLLRADQVVE